jgi:hypothetical protein
VFGGEWTGLTSSDTGYVLSGCAVPFGHDSVGFGSIDEDVCDLAICQLRGPMPVSYLPAEHAAGVAHIVLIIAPL